MAIEPEEGHLPEPEDEGGPIKSFLEHLEDLRWMLIKSCSAVGIAFVICLLAGNKVVEVLLRPLHLAKIEYPGTNHVVTTYLGTNRLGVYEFDTVLEKTLDLGTNRFVAIDLVPITITNGGTNLQVLGFRSNPDQSLAESAQHVNISIANLGPADAFMTAVTVAIYAGIAIASPFVFYFISQFVFPALRMREKRYIYRGLGFGLGLFLIGVSFCYFLLMPVALAASQRYSNWLGFTSSMWKADDYISFVCKFMLGMGLGFELPVVILVLVKLRILNYRILSVARPYMIVINFILGAVLTTPEVITQVLMALPLQLLFEISVWIAWYWERQDRKRAEKEQESSE